MNEQNRKSQNLAGQLNALLIQVNQYELRVANALWGEKTYSFLARLPGFDDPQLLRHRRGVSRRFQGQPRRREEIDQHLGPTTDQPADSRPDAARLD